MITFIVYGEPKGKGRPRFTKNGRAYTPVTTQEYENAVKAIDAVVNGTWASEFSYNPWGGEVFHTGYMDANGNDMTAAYYEYAAQLEEQLYSGWFDSWEEYEQALADWMAQNGVFEVYGVFKAYQTRVGNGPMPTEFNETSEGELCDYVRNTGNEFGVTTGRARRCGYLDLVALRYACHVNSIDSLVLTHLDVYDEMDEIEACVAYDIDGQIVTDFPTSIPALNKAKPVLQKFKGWKSSIKELKKYKQLPKAAKEYVDFIEDYTGTKIGIVSVGPDRNQTFNREKIWHK